MFVVRTDGSTDRLSRYSILILSLKALGTEIEVVRDQRVSGLAFLSSMPCATRFIHLRVIESIIILSLAYHHVYSREGEEEELASKVYTAIRRYFGFDDD